MALTPKQARAVYDRIGRVQDWQAFYEDATTDRLVANADFAGDQKIFEFGCGTARLAAQLLTALPADDGFADRVLSTFVFDLLDAEYARAVLDDLRRILTRGGRLCLASLTHGDRPLEQAVSRAWTGLWRVAPQLVGGCRPIAVSALLGDDWHIQHHSRVHRWGLVTDVVIATPSTCQR